MAAEGLTWEQIKAKYPNEWVILLEYEEDLEARDGCIGRVFDHSSNRAYIDQKQMGLDDAAILWTGPVHGRIWLEKP